MQVIRYVAVSVAMVMASQSMARDRVVTGTVPPTRAGIHDAVPYCAGGLERFLPGQYYFCAALRDYGNGHDGLARERFRDAAYWASKPAQFVLGLMNFNGEDTPPNRPLGVAWLALASERHDPRFEPTFAKAYLALSPDERARANVYWMDLRKDFADRRAGRRAKRAYLAELHQLQNLMLFGGSIFIDGATPRSGQSGFGLMASITASADDLFRGMDGTVTVGQVTEGLVPIGSAATEKSSPAK